MFVMQRPNLREVTKSGLRHFGLDEQARRLIVARTARGRRGLRDDSQLAFFLAATSAHGANCIDIGAHTGVILRDIVRLAPDGQHMAFEPIPELAQQLKRDFPGVDVQGCALSDQTGETEFHLAKQAEWSGLQRRDWLGAEYETITVPVRRLDDLVPAGRRVDFIKVDVEGAQVLALRGAERILSEYQPAIWFEHGTRSAGSYNTTSRDMWELLTTHGYRVWTADGDGPLDLTAFTAANDIPMWTYMAHG